ncbi:MAG: PSD1 and planctomycete cytochrome C domain-containing protein [Candidatus Hydrogenedentota bacterium]
MSQPGMLIHMAAYPRPALILGLLSVGFCLESEASDTVNYSQDVRPIFSDKCFTCHGPDETAREQDLRLDLREGFQGKSEMGSPIVAPGDLENSEIYYRIANPEPGDRMPPEDFHLKLNDAEIETIKRWIEDGAAWQGHWAFIPPTKPDLPTVTKSDWPSNGIDHFILNQLNAQELAPSRPADRKTLIRRVSLDLTGLPPTRAEVSDFLADKSDDAYEKVVDRLLASPRYGERMAWPWLDAARYADTNGYQGDQERTMYPWRDWVVQAFNDNMPFDQFSIWQLAGDLLPDATREQKLATGFNRNHMINGEGGRIAEENRVEYVFDQLETVGTVWMGLTFNCCRCHDHKYDPLTNKDYYRFFDFFNQTRVSGEGGSGQTAPILPMYSKRSGERVSKLRKDIQEISEGLKSRKRTLEPRRADWEEEQRTPLNNVDTEREPSDLEALLAIPSGELTKDQIQEISKQFLLSDREYRETNDRLDRLTRSRKTIMDRTPKVMIMDDMAKRRTTYILERGLYNKRKDEVTAGVPEVFRQIDADVPRNRLGLAQWLMNPQNPLTARVTVNRFWAEIFGQGFVKSPENFGAQGKRPSHPDLLDWLAVTFVESGWDVKALLRLMVTSATYRQSSEVSTELLAVDPENIYLARAPRFRMPSWMIRDQALFAGGLLSSKQGGPSVKPYQPNGLWSEFSFGNIKYKRDTGESLYRRSLYTYWRRIVAPPMFFDSSTRQTCTVTANRTNTPLHALATLNEPGFVEAARAFAERLLTIEDATDRERIDTAFQIAMARSASTQELNLLVQSIERLKLQFAADINAAKAYLSVGESKPSSDLDTVEYAAYASLCLALLNTDEAMTKE